MGQLDDHEEDDDEDEEEETKDQWKSQQPAKDENIREDEQDNSRVSNASSKKNLRDLARKLWLAVEVGDKLGSVQIL